MGEAKRRKKSDPFFGRRPKKGKGIVISPQVTIKENGSLVLGDGVDPVELRRAVLFWDRIRRPGNIIGHALTADEEYLKECGILKEIGFRLEDVSGKAGVVHSRIHLRAFSTLEKEEPGQWCMSEGEKSFNLEAGNGISEGRGALVELHRAIPLPAQDVPLEDLLNFKERRRDEILSLSLELDGLFSRLASAEDTHFEIQRAVREIDQRCADVISVSKEAKLKLALSDFSYGVSLEVNSTNLLAGGALGVLFGTTFGLPMATAAVGAAFSCMKLNISLGGRLERNKRSAELALSPYRVVSRLVSEPI